MCYETAGIDGVTRFLPKRHLPGGERTNDAEPSLQHNDADTCEMRGTKPRIAHPGPGEQLSNQDEDNAENNERDEKRVNNENQICRKEITHVLFHRAD